MNEKTLMLLCEIADCRTAIKCHRSGMPWLSPSGLQDASIAWLEMQMRVCRRQIEKLKGGGK